MFVAAARRTLVATVAALATLAALVVIAPAASAAPSIGNPGAALGTTYTYGQGWLSVTASDVACDGAPHTGPFSIYVGGTYVAAVTVTDGAVEDGSSVWVSRAPGEYEVTAQIPGCGSDQLPLGSLSVHARDTTITATPTTPGPYPAGAPVTFDVEVTNTGPDLVNGLVGVYLDGSFDIVEEVVDGAATFTIPSLPLGETPVEVRFAAPSVWLGSAATFELTAAPEVPALAVTSAPSTGTVGQDLDFTVQATTTLTEMAPAYFSSMAVTIDGESRPATLGSQSGGAHSTQVGGRVNLGDTPAGTRTVEVSFTGTDDLGATSTSFDVEVTALPAAITAAGPTEVTWGEDFEVTATVTADGTLPIDGTIEVRDGTDVVGTATAAAGPVTVPVSGVRFGEDRELTVHYDGGSFYDPASTTLTVDVNPGIWSVSASMDHTTAGVPATLTVTAAPPAGAPSGVVIIYRNADLIGSMDASVGTFVSDPFLPSAGPDEVRVTYVSVEPHFASTTLDETFHFDAAATTLDGSLTMNSPGRPDSTGTLSGTVCIIPDDADVADTAFSGADLTLTLTHHTTGSTSTSTSPAVEPGGGCHGTGVSAANLAPGDYTLSAAFAGNDHLAAADSYEFDFTVHHAPTEVGLAVVGAPGELVGTTTRLLATLSDPMPGHTHDQPVVFYANGEVIGSTAPVDGAAELAVNLPAGSIEVSAHYPGDEMHASTASAPLHFDVVQASATVELTVTPERPKSGETSTLTARVTVDGPAPAHLSSFAWAFAAPATSTLAGGPAEGTVTFYVNGTPVGTRTVVDGVASMPYVFAPGDNVVSVSYSGSAVAAPVSAGVITPVDIVVDAPGGPVAPDASTFPPADPDGVARLAAPPTASGTMASTGTEARTLVTLAGVLLAAGLVLVRLRRRSDRP